MCQLDERRDVPEEMIEMEVNMFQEPSEPSSVQVMDVPETEINLFEGRSLVELCRSSWHPADDRQTYLRGCKWSPDGTCCLAVVNHGGVHLIELPPALYGETAVPSERSVDVLDSAVHVPECGPVYDYCWYPGMNSAAPETCCWITTRQNAPLQMWDAFDGALRCSYRGYNNVDEVEPAISVCFSTDGSQIHAGYKKCIKTFHTQRPGREYVNQPIAGSAASLAVSPVDDTIAVGSWKTEISLYDIREGQSKSIGKMRGHTGGVTHLKFLPDGKYLVSGARKDDQLLVWDTRLYRRPLKILHRKVNTNQRIYFDVCSYGKYLVSGGTDGFVRVWNLKDELNNSTPAKEQLYPLHKDCCNGVSIHPYKPIISTSSGQHHITDLQLSDNQENIEDIEIVNTNLQIDTTITTNEVEMKDELITRKENFIENSLEFWWTGGIKR